MSTYKYIGRTSNDFGELSGRGCGQYDDAAYVNDTKGQGCWAVKGTRIIKGDLYSSFHQACEQINWMFRVNGTQLPLPTYLALSRNIGGQRT